MKVCEGRITSKFGNRIHPVTKEKGSFHNGVDIACPIGTPVFSPGDCVVAQTYDHEIGGKTIILREAATNDRFGFCHLGEILVRPGMVVKKGHLIAKSGNTGRSTGPHLHFSYGTGGYWKNGVCYQFKYLDPTSKIDIK
ncbi:MAG: hypothetical protein BGO30_08600 [Bacteroidetes bacterium 41-46]|nr:MAG: hypothetical protein BGO30_08600 [Bacteroidetes bacterium 41-46]